jgi:hypothetical protein
LISGFVKPRIVGLLSRNVESLDLMPDLSSDRQMSEIEMDNRTTRTGNEDLIT